MLVFCSGMKRSGSTWQYNAVCRILELRCRMEPVGFLADDELAVRRDELRGWAEDPDCVYIIKTHAIAERQFADGNREAVRTTYTYRDIRDVAASAKQQFGAGGSRLMAILDEALEAYDQVAALPGAILQRYEDFTADPARAVKDLAAYFDLELSAEESAAVVAACSVEAMKQIADKASGSFRKRLFKGLWHLSRQVPLKRFLLKCGFPLPLWIKLRNRVRPYDSQTLLRPGHVSESGGASGRWVETLTGDEIRQIEQRYSAWLAAYNTNGSDS